MKIITESMNTKFELHKEEDGTKLWNVRAISVTTTGNNREYTRDELKAGARSLSFRPLNINHDPLEALPYPDNQTLEMDFDINTDAVTGRIQVDNPEINAMIERGDINKLSIEQQPVQGEVCDDNKCTQKGVTFTALALLTKDMTAGDESTTISKTESVKKEDCLEDCLDAKRKAGVEITDDVVAQCMEDCKKADTDDKVPDSDKPKDDLPSENSSEKEDCKCSGMSNDKIETPSTDKVEETPIVDTPKVDTTVADTTSTPANVTLSADQFDRLVSRDAGLIDKFSLALDKLQTKEEPEAESEPSSKVADVSVKPYESVHQFFEAVKISPVGSSSSATWSVPLADLYKDWTKTEAVTVSSGDAPQQFNKQILVTPDGKTSTPIRQFCQVVSLSGADRAHFYKMGGVSFGAFTEGTEPTNESQSVTKITVTPTIRGGVQRIGYSQLEDVPALTNAINQSFALEAITDEEKLLHAEFDSVTPSNWINGNSGATITDDDVAGMTMTGKAIVYGKKKIAEQGYATNNLVFLCDPKAYAELLTDSNISTFTQQGQPSITAKGSLEELYGVSIVVSNNITNTDNSTNDTLRNLLFVKGAFGIASSRDLSMESQRDNSVQQVIISGTQRLAVKTIDEKQVCRISTAQ
jgi:HK97 family phage major capsid protein